MTTERNAPDDLIGLDGFSRGWVAVTIDGARRAIDFVGHAEWLVTQDFTRAAIDIPIGLSDDGRRACDVLARQKLSPHGARVFSGARRWLWQQFSDPDLANAEATRRGQSRVSRQLWHLGPKIMEVDAVVRAHPARDIREAHPELVFLRLNGGVPLTSKHSVAGLALRRDLLLREGFHDLDVWLMSPRAGTGAKRDDVLDACAMAIAARDCAGCVPPGEPPRDGVGLPQQIWS